MESTEPNHRDFFQSEKDDWCLVSVSWFDSRMEHREKRPSPARLAIGEAFSCIGKSHPPRELSQPSCVSQTCASADYSIYNIEQLVETHEIICGRARYLGMGLDCALFDVRELMKKKG